MVSRTARARSTAAPGPRRRPTTHPRPRAPRRASRAPGRRTAAPSDPPPGPARSPRAGRTGRWRAAAADRPPRSGGRSRWRDRRPRCRGGRHLGGDVEVPAAGGVADHERVAPVRLAPVVLDGVPPGVDLEHEVGPRSTSPGRTTWRRRSAAPGRPRAGTRPLVNIHQGPSSPRTTLPVQVARSSNAGSGCGASASAAGARRTRSSETACPTQAWRCRRSGSPSERGACRKNRWCRSPSCGGPEVPDPVVGEVKHAACARSTCAVSGAITGSRTPRVASARPGARRPRRRARCGQVATWRTPAASRP